MNTLYFAKSDPTNGTYVLTPIFDVGGCDVGDWFERESGFDSIEEGPFYEFTWSNLEDLVKECEEALRKGKDCICRQYMPPTGKEQIQEIINKIKDFKEKHQDDYNSGLFLFRTE